MSFRTTPDKRQTATEAEMGIDRATESGAGIMEADDRQVTTVFTGQPSFHHRHSTNPIS